MGYERESAIYALKVTSNNIEHACSFLLSNPNPIRQSNPSMRIGLSNFLNQASSSRSTGSSG